MAQEAAGDDDGREIGLDTSALPSASITIMVSTAPAPKPPSVSAKGRPSRPCSASLPQSALLQPPFSFMYFLRASKS